MALIQNAVMRERVKVAIQLMRLVARLQSCSTLKEILRALREEADKLGRELGEEDHRLGN